MFRRTFLQIARLRPTFIRLASGPPICSLPNDVTTPKRYMDYAKVTADVVVTDLRNKICALPPGPSVAYMLDVLSDKLCQVADTAEALRSLHSNRAWADVGHEVRILYEGLIADLNSDKGLADAVRASLEDPAIAGSLDSETLRVLGLLDKEFLSTHLPADERKRLVKLQHETSRLIGAFRQAVGNGSGTLELFPDDGTVLAFFSSLSFLSSSPVFFVLTCYQHSAQHHSGLCSAP